MSTDASNLLIDKLPAECRAQLKLHLEPVFLAAGTTLCEPLRIPEYAHFMTSGLTCYTTLMSNGTGAEVSLVGREGIVEGLHAISSSGPGGLTHAVVQVSGTALRMRFPELRRGFLAAEPLRRVVLEFVQSQSSLLGQISACNRLHEVERRLARWLLMAQDRTGKEVLPLTQELLATMLGTRRSSVTLAARNLHRGGLIEYHRGQVHIVNRESLEGAACECYAVARRLYVSLYN